MDALQDYPQIQYILALHEGVAVAMADAYARLTRRPAFVQLHLNRGIPYIQRSKVGRNSG